MAGGAAEAFDGQRGAVRADELALRGQVAAGRDRAARRRPGGRAPREAGIDRRADRLAVRGLAVGRLAVGLSVDAGGGERLRGAVGLRGEAGGHVDPAAGRAGGEAGAVQPAAGDRGRADQPRGTVRRGAVAHAGGGEGVRVEPDRAHGHGGGDDGRHAGAHEHAVRPQQVPEVPVGLVLDPRPDDRQAGVDLAAELRERPLELRVVLDALQGAGTARSCRWFDTRTCSSSHPTSGGASPAPRRRISGAGSSPWRWAVPAPGRRTREWRRRQWRRRPRRSGRRRRGGPRRPVRDDASQ